MQPAGDDPWWTTSVVVGPNTERDERVANRQRYGATAATLGDARRLYFQRALELVEEFDRSFETCVRDAEPTTRVETILDEVAQKCSHGLDQAWFALWQTSIAPRALWTSEKQREKAQAHVYFPVTPTAARSLADSVGGANLAAVIEREQGLRDIVCGPHPFMPRADWVWHLKNVAAYKHRGAAKLVRTGPRIGVRVDYRDGSMQCTMPQKEMLADGAYRLTIRGTWRPPDAQPRRIPLEFIVCDYWGHVEIPGVDDDAVRFVHENIRATLLLVSKMDALLTRGSI